MSRERFVVAHDFEDRRFFPGQKTIPYDFSGAKMRDEIAKNAPELDVILSSSEEETMALAPTADYMALDKIRRRIFDAAANLKWVHIASSGADHFFKRSDVTADDFRRRKIAITTSKGAGAVVIAEQILCFMLMFSRNMTRCMRQHLIGHWERYAALELSGMTVGLIGVGAIGGRVAYLAKALGMTVLGCRQDVSKTDPNVDRMFPADQYLELMKQSDFVLLAVPINSKTSRFINYDVLSVMKPTAFFMNVARGECIDEEGLVRALVDGKIAGYASDNHGFPKGEVTDENMERLESDSKLWGMPNVIITPNNAVAGPRRYEYMAKIAVDNYRAMKAGAPMKTRLIWNGQPV
jgi:phosphoglycerate dehydrogenase-like enzyme